jgi:hypothetical protein
MNAIQTTMRSCYTNEVKSAKELKISMKGSNPYFYPCISFSMVQGSETKLDLRSKKPENINGLGNIPNPL